MSQKSGRSWPASHQLAGRRKCSGRVQSVEAAALRFNSQILTDVWARQENRVNIGGGTAPETFIFHADTPLREALLK